MWSMQCWGEGTWVTWQSCDAPPAQGLLVQKYTLSLGCDERARLARERSFVRSGQSLRIMTQEYAQLVSGLRAAFASGRTRSEEFRRHNLKQLLRLYEENEERLVEAIEQDVGKKRHEVIIYELNYIKNELITTLYKLHKWMNPPKPYKNFMFFWDDVKVVREPLGVVLIIGPLNYPIKLVTLPLQGAIAAGNCAIMKPSHLTPKCGALLAKLVPKYLDPDCYKVVLADPAETGLLLEQRFDYIFMTGSQSTGRVVAAAAARHLTPVTLQMGGKCPLYLSDDVRQIESAVRRIVSAKFACLGQMCIVPDYVLCTPKTRDVLVRLFIRYIREMYGEQPQRSKDLARIINKEKVKRLENMLRSTRGRVVSGGTVDYDDLWVSPTLVVDVPRDDVLMQEEIFGPILPAVLVNDREDAIQFIRSRGKPLVVYVFSEDKKTQRMFSEQVLAGALCVNDITIYAAVTDLPFGGVGESGMGPKYHGIHSFLTFTSEKGSVVRRLGRRMDFLAWNRFPPFHLHPNKLRLSKWYMRPTKPARDLTAMWIILLFIGLLIYSAVLLTTFESCLVVEYGEQWPCNLIATFRGIFDGIF